MATADPTADECFNEYENGDDSLTKMSEEAKEMYCEHCEKEIGTYVTADGFCVECVEYLCPTCIRYHKKYVKEHTLQDNAHMPQDFCFDKCSLHPTEIIKFYCESCDETVCPECKSENHKDCTSVCHIPSKVQTNEVNEELNQVTQIIDDTLEELTVTQERANSDLTEVHSKRIKASVAIRKHKDNLKGQVQDQHKQLLDKLDRKQAFLIEKNDQHMAYVIAKLQEEKRRLLLKLQYEKRYETEKLKNQEQEMFENIDKAEQDLDKKSEKINQNDATKLQLVVSETKNIVTKVNKMKKSIDTKVKKNEKCGLFVEMKEVKHSLNHLRTDSERLADYTNVTFYEFQPSEVKINLATSTYKFNFGKFLVDESEVKRTIDCECSINANSDTDKRNSYLTGICKYSDFLVVVDKSNKSIKLVNTKEKRLSSFLQLQGEPFDVTCVERDEVAATLPEGHKIQFFSITEEGVLSMTNEIDVGKSCYGIEYKKPNLVVAFPKEVQILSTTGVSIRKFSDFSNTKYIHLDSSDKTFYIQGPSLTKVSYDGQIVKSSYSLKSSGLAVDHYGSVFAIHNIGTLKYWSPGTNFSVIQLSANLEEIQKIDISQYTHKAASCICYCKKEHKLYVGIDAGTILVFKLT